LGPYACVLLDLDGTLTDSKPGIIASYEAALRALGHEPDPCIDLTFVVGPAMNDVMAEVLAHYDDTRVHDAVAAYRRHYGTVGLFENSVYDGIKSLLIDVKAAGHRVYLTTSKRTVFARQVLEHLELVGYFDGIYGSEPDGALDHKPELIAYVLAREGIEPSDAVMIGDRRYDIAGAHANGVRAFGVLWGYGSRAELEQAGADLLVSSPAELTSALLRSQSE
jgi:phosphoglycolate phosphatase